MGKIQIRKTITLNVTKNGDKFLVDDLGTLSLIYGSASVSGNERVYKYSKENGKFIVPVNVIRERIDILKARRDKINQRLELMEQLITK